MIGIPYHSVVDGSSGVSSAVTSAAAVGEDDVPVGTAVDVNSRASAEAELTAAGWGVEQAERPSKSRPAEMSFLTEPSHWDGWT